MHIFNTFLNVLVAYPRDDAFVAIDKPPESQIFSIWSAHSGLVLVFLRLDRFRVGRAGIHRVL